jgi:hypothetical protein
MKTLNDLTLAIYAANSKAQAKSNEHNFAAVKMTIAWHFGQKVTLDLTFRHVLPFG